MKTRTLTKREVELAPYEVWNAYVDLLAMEQYDDLTPTQRAAHLVFWYESEVQNGGHFQFFENLGNHHLDETIDALGVLCAINQQKVLRDAAMLWRSHPRSRVQSAEEFCNVALEGEFDAHDSRFHECKPTLNECLESYLQRHQSTFVIVK